MSNAIETETRNDRAENWKVDEKELQEIPIFNDFTYDSCSNIGRRRRFAMMEEKVHLNDYEMAIYKRVLADNGDKK